MVAQQLPKNKNKPMRSEENKQAKKKRTRAVPKPAGTSKVQEEDKLGIGSAVAKTRKTLETVQVDAELAHDAHKKSRKTTPKAREESLLPPAPAQERKAYIRRDSFVVRLSVDENYQFGRTEIEHIASSRKQSFLDLNGDHLVAFMKACITPVLDSSSAAHDRSVSQKAKDPVPVQLRAQSNFVVSDIQLIRSGDADMMSLTLVSEKPFTLQAHFKFEEPEAGSFSTHELSFEIKVHATEITSGTARLLVTHNVKLIQGLEEYIVPIEVSGLPQGLYRLFTVAKLEGYRKAASLYEGPVIQVI